uniref:Uncharacterized protein n=2 Tax=Varanus komodoensis TaxID=61221 RepID=A0A8D2LH41_VARKO
MEARMMQRQAPPSYGQLIARGVIPPVEGFPTEHSNQNSMLGSLRSLLCALRHDPATAAPGGHRPHRSRFVRRLVRRMRRMGLLSRPAPASPSSAAATSSPSHAVPDAVPEPSPGDGDAPSAPQGDQAPPLPQKVPPAPAEPAPEPPAPPPGPPPRLSGMMRTLRLRLFSPAPPCFVEAPDPLSAPPSPADEDDVLLVPLAEPHLASNTSPVAWEADDEPLLT